MGEMTNVEKPEAEPRDEQGASPPSDLEPSDRETESVRGGTTPAPGGPVPIPYPNVSTRSA
jgi:hypothetical protein